MLPMRIAMIAVSSALLLISITTVAAAACLVEPILPEGGLVWPAVGIIDREWSLSCITDRGHRGIDIDLSEGERIGAAASGVVSFTGYTPAENGGGTVSVAHQGGLKTTYLHVKDIAVSEGEDVKQGQLLGLSDGRPLHFGLKSIGGDRYADPVLLLPETAEMEPQISSEGPEELPVAASGESVSQSVTSSAPEPVAGTEPGLLGEEASPDLIPSPAVRSHDEASEISARTVKEIHNAPVRKSEETAHIAISASGIIAGSSGFGIASLLGKTTQAAFLDPEIAQPGSLRGYDGLLVPAWFSLTRDYQRRSAGLGLLVSTLALTAIRKLVWNRPKLLEVGSWGKECDEPSGPGALHRLTA